MLDELEHLRGVRDALEADNDLLARAAASMGAKPLTSLTTNSRRNCSTGRTQLDMTITYENEEGEEVSVQLPSKKAVCGGCEGEGYQLHPGMRGHVYTREEFQDAFDDDQREQYFTRGGIYDVICEVCHGRNVVDEVDEDRLTDEQREHYEVWGKTQAADAEYEAMCRAERLMGA